MRQQAYKYKTGFVIAATSLMLLLVSCAREDFDWLIGTPVNVVATTQPVTRSDDNIQTAYFDEDEKINAYYNVTGGGVIGKEPTILTAGKADNNGKNRLTPDVQPYYPQEGTVDILALYPPTQATKGISDFTVEADQTDEANYKLSDLMWAGKTSQPKTKEDINLQFHHMMAKMSVKVTGTDGVQIKKVSLCNIVRTVAITDLSAASCTLAEVGEDGTKEEILLASASTESTDLDNTLSGSVLFPGQTVAGNFIKVETNWGEGDKSAYFSVANKEFKGGKEYSADLVVSRQEIGFVTAITDWENNGGSIAVPPGSSAGLKIEAIPDQPYDGNPKTPSLTITYSPNDALIQTIGGTTGYAYPLEAGKDYEVEYFNNTSQGTAVVIITGKKSPDRTGNMEALANVIAQIKSMTSFKITAHAGELSYPATIPAQTKTVEYDYNTKVDHQLDAHGGDGTITYTSSDESVADVTNSGVVTIRKVGTTRITAKMANDGNYTAAETYYDLTVSPRSLSKHQTAGDVTATLAAYSYPYTGEYYKPAVVVKDKGRTLQEGKHYTYEVANNVDKGTATITLRGTGNYSAEVADAITIDFTIETITPKITFDETAAKVAKGQKFTRLATTDYGTITYRSDPEGYVSIDNGVVTALKVDANHTAKTVKIYAEVSANANNNWSATSKSYDLTVVESEWSYIYSATGQKHTWTCPIDGVYELEAMGAQGATTDAFTGGRGADVAGQVFIKEGQKLYIYLGQGGSVRNTSYTFNGGGYYSGSKGNDVTTRFTGGGGATDFALKDASWDSNDHLYSRILVAGGGGGALYYESGSTLYVGGGGCGGGEGTDENNNIDYVGETGYAGSLPGKGGTLSAGGTMTAGGSNGNAGSFGKGGHYNGSISAGCGGGGWYGGASGSQGGRQGSGGGGSSFIYNAANLTAVRAGGADYTLQFPSQDNYFDASLEITPTILVTGGSPDVNGQARITYKSAE